MDYFGYQIPEDVISEISGLPAVDIHHIEPRGMGGSKEKDNIFNIIALTREEHERAEDGTYSKDFLKQIHINFLNLQK